MNRITYNRMILIFATVIALIALFFAFAPESHARTAGSFGSHVGGSIQKPNKTLNNRKKHNDLKKHNDRKKRDDRAKEAAARG